MLRSLAEAMGCMASDSVPAGSEPSRDELEEWMESLDGFIQASGLARTGTPAFAPRK